MKPLSRMTFRGDCLSITLNHYISTMVLILFFCVFISAPMSWAADSVVDSIQFGNPDSEVAHDLDSELSKAIEGKLGQPARRLLTPENKDWRGGRITFDMKVDPDNPNYFTAKFWGGETATKERGVRFRPGHESRLCLFIDGEQVGQRHLGEVEMLDIMGHDGGRYPGRFYYKTLPLPLHMTQGRKSVELAIEGQGGINGYAADIADYQKMMVEPSRAIYRAYVHTEPCIVPAPDEVQGTPPVYPVRSASGLELINKLKTMLNEYSNSIMGGRYGNHVNVIQYLGKAYHTPWNMAYHNPGVIELIAEMLDGHYRDYRADESSIAGVRWIGKGPAANGLCLVFKDIKPYLDDYVEGTKVPRRKAWGELFIASRNDHAAKRRSLTNQSMILDMNVYHNNLAARLLGSSKAWPEKKARLLLYESFGLEPWSGSWTERARPDWNQGKHKFLFTEQGLSRENGYVGAYGEIVDLARMMYEATKPSPEAEGDPRLKKQLIKMTRARGVFRYPLADADGYRCMSLETVIGWRDWKYPGAVVYDQMNGSGGGSFDIAIATQDPVLMGYGQQVLEDNQFFAGVKKRMEARKSKRGLLSVPENYKIIAALPESSTRLPMSEGQPDFVFSDPMDGVIAVKNGHEILYASLYWRSRSAINNLARVHYLTPTMERDATVNITTEFNDSGKTYTLPDWTNMGFGKGREEQYYRNLGMKLAMAGQKQPIANVPRDVKTYETGQENIYAGKGDLYIMTYGSYFVAMNCTDKRSLSIDVPEKFLGGKDLVSGQTCNVQKVRIKPKQTIVLYR